MKTLYLLSTCCLLFVFTINQSIAQSQEVRNLKSENLSIETDYLDLKIETWDKDYIELWSVVKINMSRDDDKHELIIRNDNSGINITSNVNTEDIDKMVILTDKEGSKTYISMENWDNKRKDREFYSMNMGYEIDGSMTLYIPKKMNLYVSTTYGDVFIDGFYDAIKTQSTYGLVEAKLDNVSMMRQVSMKSTYDVVDLTLDKGSNASLSLHTSYGSVYTDLPLQTTQLNNKNQNHGWGQHSEKYILNEGSVGIDLVATYDNIYIRSYQ